MLGIVYALLIAGWIVLIIILKWRKSRIKREVEEQQMQQQQMRPQIHVIQIGSSLYDVIQISPNQNNNNYCCDCPDYNQCAIDSCHHNNGFVLEDGAVFPAGPEGHHNYNRSATSSPTLGPPPPPIPTPPPSYDEVMREIDARNRARLMTGGRYGGSGIIRDDEDPPKNAILSAARDRNTITTPPNYTNQI